jgi:hypothetical protein
MPTRWCSGRAPWRSLKLPRCNPVLTIACCAMKVRMVLCQTTRKGRAPQHLGKKQLTRCADLAVYSSPCAQYRRKLDQFSAFTSGCSLERNKFCCLFPVIRALFLPDLATNNSTARMLCHIALPPKCPPAVALYFYWTPRSVSLFWPFSWLDCLHTDTHTDVCSRGLFGFLPEEWDRISSKDVICLLLKITWCVFLKFRDSKSTDSTFSGHKGPVLAYDALK